jgi:hypothetical protein
MSLLSAGRLAAFLALAAVLGAPLRSAGPVARAGELRYPDLKALPPRDARFDAVSIDGAPHIVLRFTAIEWNAGPGPLELRPVDVDQDGRMVVTQWVYDDADGYQELEAGHFVYHPTHQHWHFEQFAAYELWTQDDYDQWLASGRSEGGPRWLGSKTTGLTEGVCLRDSGIVSRLPGTPDRMRYNLCGLAMQGLSVGWADAYDYRLPDQWIDCGEALPPDGDYVLRLVVDPLNLIYESDDKADPARESPAANDAVTAFSLRGGAISPR